MEKKYLRCGILREGDLYDFNVAGIKKNVCNICLTLRRVAKVPKILKPLKRQNRFRSRREAIRFYRKYIASREWKVKREERLVIANNKCETCGNDKFLQVHHLTYKRLGDENIGDLKVLCGTCHQKVHGLIEDL